jgi:hypothetical protein
MVGDEAMRETATREAAERIASVETQGDIDRMYPGIGGLQRAFAEAVTVARAYLSLVPADDGVEITEDWLRSVGFEAMPSEVGLWLNKTVGVDLRSESPGCVVCNARPRITTRGDLRRLAEALGIPLEPSP